MFKNLKQENGYSLLLVILTIAFISVLGITLLTLTANSLKTSANERDDQSVFYIAEGGLNSTKSKVEQLVKITYDENRKKFNKLPLYKRKPERFKLDFIDAFESSLEKIFEKNQSAYNDTVTFDEQFNENPIANVKVIQENTEPLQYKITSVGTIGKKTRTVAQTITIDLGSGTGSGFSNSAAIHAIKDIELGGGKLNGDVVSDSGKISITQDSTKITGKIGTTPDKFSKLDWMNVTNEIIGNIAFPKDVLPPFPDNEFTSLSTKPYTNSVQVIIDGKQTQLSLENHSIKIDGGGNGHINGYQKFSGTLPLTQDMYLKTLTVSSDRKLTIDVGNSDKNLYIDNFDFFQGHLNITGSGRLTLYIKNAFNLKGSSSMNNTGDIGRLSVYYTGTSLMDFTGDTKTKGSIYAKSADININGSGSVQGNLYAGGSNITVEGGAYNHGLYIYAPDAKVTMKGSGEVIGGIMAYTVNTSGGSTVTYKQKMIEDTISNGGLVFEENDNLTISNSMLEVE
ncbi:pilus assembly PilX N-terminal domain-containing protein [Lysinibacillus sp. NPDC056232]|uniref:pilus assembly PilX N-terminal domain-containing protein n=1 Tax=Lysinibacillus sp. NPDC056232 TaxID=3345756 RepID=UPI0035E1C6ED